MKPTLYMLIGLPGSGKSTYAKNLAEKEKALILSSDELRKEMYGDERNQEHNTEIFTELHKRCKKSLLELNNIIYDACNINHRRRVSFLKGIEKIECIKKAIIFATPYELCLQNNNSRERKVPRYAISNMRQAFQLPLCNEGYDSIEIVWNTGEMIFDSEQLMTKAVDFNQKNSHHTLSLGGHMIEALNYLNGNNQDLSFELQMATKFHDIGKFETQTFVDKKGNVSEEAHYYGHNFVGAYNAMFYLKQYKAKHITDEEILHICTLIQYHMHPYLAWKTSEKAKQRDKNILGETWFNEILLLHEADLAAH